MDFATVVSVLLIGAACVFFVFHTAKGTGKFSPDGEAAIGVLGGFGLFVVVLAAIFLSGCNIAPKVVSSSPRTVSVKSLKGMAIAQSMADAECAKHGRHAKWVSGDVVYIFDCVT